MITRILLTVLLTTSIATANAENTSASVLTLHELLEDLKSSPQMLKAQSAQTEGHWKKMETSAAFLPSLSIGATRILSKEYLLTDIAFPGATQNVSVPQIVPTTTYFLSANWLLFDGLANVNRYQAAAQNEDALSRESEWTDFTLRKNMTYLYYQALAGRTLREVAQQNEKVLSDHLRDVSVLKKSGISTNYDLLRAEVKWSEAKSEVLNATDSELLSFLRLSDASGKKYDGRTLDGHFPQLTSDIVRDLPASIESRGDLKSLQLKIQSVENIRKAASKHWFPKVALFAQYQNYNNLGNSWTSTAEFRDAHLIGLNLSWELFDGMVAVAKDKELTEQRFQMEQGLLQLKQKLSTDFEYWKRRFSYFLTIISARKSEIDKASESVRLAKEGVRVGSRTNTDLLDAERELYQAKAGFVTSQLGAVEAVINLELMTGHNLYEFERN